MKYISTFSGIGGFELGIQLAYESKVSLWNGQTKDRESTPPQSSVESTSESLLSDRNITNPELWRDTGEVSCIGYSEIDKYASAIYQKHFPYEQCKRCRTKNEGQRVQRIGDTEGFNSERDNISPVGLTCTCKHKPYGDITKIVAEDLPDFDLLVGGFPCQAFSIAGKRGGFEDTRGTMFFELARILRAKQPRLFVFENVKGLLSHDGGKSFATIIQTLDELGYDCQWQVLNSKNHGVPQNRERVFIVGHLRGTPRPQVFPFGSADTKDTRNVGEDLSYALDASYAKGTNTLEKGRRQLIQLNNPTHSNDRVYGADGISPTLNTMQGGNRQPFIPEDSRIRRLTPTECERLQGFPDGWTEGVSDTQRYKTLGNAVTVNVIRDIFERII
jgi:DNA (cytosine-5)-methyltransferase 1